MQMTQQSPETNPPPAAVPQPEPTTGQNPPPNPPPNPAPTPPAQPTNSGDFDIAGAFNDLAQRITGIPEQAAHAVREAAPTPPASPTPPPTGTPANNPAGSANVETKQPNRLVRFWFGKRS